MRSALLSIIFGVSFLTANLVEARQGRHKPAPGYEAAAQYFKQPRSVASVKSEKKSRRHSSKTIVKNSKKAKKKKHHS